MLNRLERPFASNCVPKGIGRYLLGRYLLRSTFKEKSHDTRDQERRRKSPSVVLKMHDYKIVRVWVMLFMANARMRDSNKTTVTRVSNLFKPISLVVI